MPTHLSVKLAERRDSTGSYGTPSDRPGPSRSSDSQSERELLELRAKIQRDIAKAETPTERLLLIGYLNTLPNPTVQPTLRLAFTEEEYRAYVSRYDPALGVVNPLPGHISRERLAIEKQCEERFLREAKEYHKYLRELSVLCEKREKIVEREKQINTYLQKLSYLRGVTDPPLRSFVVAPSSRTSTPHHTPPPPVIAPPAGLTRTVSQTPAATPPPAVASKSTHGLRFPPQAVVSHTRDEDARNTVAALKRPSSSTPTPQGPKKSRVEELFGEGGEEEDQQSEAGAAAAQPKKRGRSKSKPDKRAREERREVSRRVEEREKAEGRQLTQDEIDEIREAFREEKRRGHSRDSSVAQSDASRPVSASNTPQEILERRRQRFQTPPEPTPAPPAQPAPQQLQQRPVVVLDRVPPPAASAPAAAAQGKKKRRKKRKGGGTNFEALGEDPDVEVLEEVLGADSEAVKKAKAEQEAKDKEAREHFEKWTASAKRDKELQEKSRRQKQREEAEKALAAVKTPKKVQTAAQKKGEGVASGSTVVQSEPVTPGSAVIQSEPVASGSAVTQSEPVERDSSSEYSESESESSYSGSSRSSSSSRSGSASPEPTNENLIEQIDEILGPQAPKEASKDDATPDEKEGDEDDSPGELHIVLDDEDRVAPPETEDIGGGAADSTPARQRVPPGREPSGSQPTRSSPRRKPTAAKALGPPPRLSAANTQPVGQRRPRDGSQSAEAGTSGSKDVDDRRSKKARGRDTERRPHSRDQDDRSGARGRSRESKSRPRKDRSESRDDASEAGRARLDRQAKQGKK